MTPKWFLSLAARGGIKSATAFLATHREWLETGELADEAAPVLLSIDAKETLPTPGLETIMKAALHHVMAQDTLKVEEQINRPPREYKNDKPYQGVVYNQDGTIATTKVDGNDKELRSGFDHSQEADRWCQRRLSECYSGQYAEVIWTKVIGKNGKPMVTRHERESAIKAMIPRTRSPYMHTNRASGSLKSRMSVGQTQVRFSRG
jgi:hypothetical protein